MRARSLRILYVEDNPSDAELLIEGLRAEGAHTAFIVHVSRLSEAQAALRRERFDVVLLDLGLPDSDGLDTLRSLLEDAPNRPVVVLTGLDDEDVGAAAMREGAQDYLVKGHASRNPLTRTMRHAIERHKLHAELRRLSLQDELTGLWNRRGFTTLADHQLKLAQRAGTPAQLFMFDLDRLKQINDTFGHAEGDAVLRDIAAILQLTFRDADVVARVGGDEFSVLALDADPRVVEQIVSRLHDKLERHNGPAGERGYTVSVTAGIAAFDPQAPVPLAELTHEADRELYKRKRARHGAGREDGR